MSLGDKILGTIAAARLDGKKAVSVVVFFEDALPAKDDDGDYYSVLGPKRWKAVLDIKENRSVSEIIDDIHRAAPDFRYDSGSKHYSNEQMLGMSWHQQNMIGQMGAMVQMGQMGAMVQMGQMGQAGSWYQPLEKTQTKFTIN